uniref:Uncharacterized protein n=1 Tax=Solanum lycopersicum TaxID=4081 RepID=K4BDY9_SOLLC|nr:probable disease resistance protein RF45 [Solanum lycopersicum]
MEKLAATMKLEQLALAKETQLIGSKAYEEIMETVHCIKNLETTDREQVNEIEEHVYRVENAIQTYGVRSKSNLFLNRHGAAQKKAMTDITSLCRVMKGIALLQKSNNNQQLMRQNNKFVYNHEDGAVVVGMEDEKEEIIQVLLLNSQVSSEVDFQAVPIWGRSGMGKATLVNEIYNDPRIVKEFGHPHLVNIRLSENINAHDALQHVFELFEGSRIDDKYVDMSTTSLEDCVRQHLEMSRTLIVLQGVGSIDDWRMLRSVLGAKGCIILITTRARQVAESITQAIHIHEKRPLTEENSWKLFKEMVWPGGAEIQSAILERMVKLCEGIPGAIIALAKQLAGKNASEWEITEQKNARRDVSQVMAPSYAELLDDQKLYFLYLGQFREDSQIEPEKLSHLWEIEGLISSSSKGHESGMTLLDITQERLKVLAQKGMIDVRRIIDVIKSCHLVGLMGDMCLSKAEETDFLKVMDLSNQLASFSFGRTRRVVIYLGKYDAEIKPELASNIWSLRIIRSVVGEFAWPSTLMSNIKEFKSLRILDFGRVDFPRGELPKGISDLQFLRYLSFEGCFLAKLHSSISNLSYLQVLDLRTQYKENGNNTIIPYNVFQKMARLQHLYLPLVFQLQNGKKLRLDGLAELQTLKNLNSKLCEIRHLFKLKKLRNLDAKVEVCVEDLNLITDFMKSRSDKGLRRCSLEVKNFDCYSDTKHSAFREILNSGVPPIVSFEGYIKTLPPYFDISQNFTEIVLRSTQLEEDPMPTLEKLNNLRLLVLEDDAFKVNQMVCSASGFQELKHLELSRLFSFEKWRVEISAMPMLSHLKIEYCNELVTLPDGSEFLDSLQEFKMIKMPESFTQKVTERYDHNHKRPPSFIVL